MSSVAHKALRPIALFEAFKGALVVVAVIAAFGALRFLGQDAQHLAEQMVRTAHVDPANHYARIFIKWMADVTNTRLWLYAGFAAPYATIRFIEAYGLWHERRWAEWIAALSGAIYVPFEVYELVRQVTWIRITFLCVNLIVVAYMVWLLSENRRRRAAAQMPAA